MSNLDELRALLEKHPKTILVEDLPDEDFGFYLFWRITYETGDNEANQESVCIIVKNRGKTGEQAWFKGRPRYMRDLFKDKVQIAVDSYRNKEAKIEHCEIEAVNEGSKTAIVRAYVYDSTMEALSIVRYLVWEKADFSLGFRKLVG